MKRRKLGDPLPKYLIQNDPDMKGWLEVTCPYEDCDGLFLVEKRHWLRPRRYTDTKGKTYSIAGRSCPYCQRVAMPSRKE